MRIILENVSKRYRYQWVIRNANITFEPNTITGLQGPNGSGKSTLLKIISGFLSPTSGRASYFVNEQAIISSEVYKTVSFVAPYTELIKEFSLKEQFDFHFTFKNQLISRGYNDFVEFLNLKVESDKIIDSYSSGMNQRLQLALALWSDNPLLLLDEPTAYLDDVARDWFYKNLREKSKGRTIIIASNDRKDFEVTHKILDITLL